MFIQLDNNGISTLKALSSDTRVTIIHLLSNEPSTVSEIAKKLNLSKAIVSRHLRLLEDARIIKLDDSKNSSDNRTKNFKLAVDHIDIDFPKKIHLPFQESITEIKLGYFSDFSAEPTCGLVSETKVIGELDDPRSFVSNERIEASLLWFSDGFVEYVVPNQIPADAHLELLELSLELSSEFPESNNNWPSDISFFINDIPLGTWTAPGNYSDVRGTLTPKWWASTLSQYGVLKHIRVTNTDTGIDGKMVSNTKLNDLKLDTSPFIKVKIGVKPDAKNKGGLTIFGNAFGNHPQNILLKCFYSDHH
ncbi:putative transcriptional regulator [Enterococcus sp. PF1-24]|uniref:ArsR/SmtB family transcription factor n=1 Tax=unclassified Enterococcus TaxID=2608891 RepID=UPI00247465D2|nr:MULTISPECIES: ArsR family transcriptional regulator [unclassified Enterococcus]MDH6363997.1 putative transcriptional regulator [Enterococcus sp. PFB1-1]MDH6401098.1 putative transcriptional regulator [Enterococcus sp. PF1-24]